MTSKKITIILELDEHASSAQDRDIRPYIERMISFSVVGNSKYWETDDDGNNVIIVEGANLRKLHVR